ncbi:hypothetical protein [Rubrivivax albus]|nr:hypothetical protein [Rubrivivax albus]
MRDTPAARATAALVGGTRGTSGDANAETGVTTTDVVRFRLGMSAGFYGN